MAACGPREQEGGYLFTRYFISTGGMSLAYGYAACIDETENGESCGNDF